VDLDLSLEPSFRRAERHKRPKARAVARTAVGRQQLAQLTRTKLYSTRR
jgi:hypothetical protein